MTFQNTVRSETSFNGCTTVERCFSDFRIEGRSLIEILVTADGGHSDFMSGFVSGLPEQNLLFANSLIRRGQSKVESCRVLIYFCPECGDIGCGAYSVHIRRGAAEIIWEAFAYENGYEEPRVIPGVGPFTFNLAAYTCAVNAASAI